MIRSDPTIKVPRQAEDARVCPGRALTTATWIAALFTLGLNDHVLKHTMLLPEFVTGKLSDIAGMFVAPALLATLLRVRTLPGVRRSYVAVFAVFAAINLMPAVSTAWTSLLGALGMPSVNVCDPTDVPFAFVAILLSWRALAPAMHRSGQLSRLQPRRAVEVISVSLGMILCVATQPKESVILQRSVPVFVPPTAKENQVVIVTEEAVSGYVELRCTDGARQELPFQIEEPYRRHSWAIFEPGPTGAVECKLIVHGALGSYGPIFGDSKLIWCRAAPGDALECVPRDDSEFPTAGGGGAEDVRG